MTTTTPTMLHPNAWPALVYAGRRVPSGGLVPVWGLWDIRCVLNVILRADVRVHLEG